MLKRSGQHKCYKDQCFAVVLYSISCYSIISPCSYWNSNTLDAIIENGSQLNNTMQSKNYLTSVTLPDCVTIFGTNINVHVNEVSHRELSNLTKSKRSLETLILRNHTEKTGFLMWISSYCIACIYQQNTKVKQLFSHLTYEDSHSPAMKQTIHIHGVDNLVEEINIIQNKQECQTMEYDIQFICCSCKITEIERKHIMRKHRKRHMYYSMEPVTEKRFLEDIKRKYSTMDAKKKKELPSQPSEKLVKARSVELCIDQFKRKIREGPYFICTVCNRILYKKSVITCINKKYPCQTYFNIQQSFDGKQYICNTCHSKVITGKLPCQAVVNNTYVDEIPTELSSLEKQEQILIAQRIVFKKIVYVYLHLLSYHLNKF